MSLIVHDMSPVQIDADSIASGPSISNRGWRLTCNISEPKVLPQSRI